MPRGVITAGRSRISPDGLLTDPVRRCNAEGAVELGRSAVTSTFTVSKSAAVQFCCHDHRGQLFLT